MKPVKQIPREPYRHCFSDDFFTLHVCSAPDEKITGFQLSYEKGPNEKALTRFESTGFSYDFVDDGEGIPGRYEYQQLKNRRD